MNEEEMSPRAGQEKAGLTRTALILRELEEGSSLSAGTLTGGALSSYIEADALAKISRKTLDALRWTFGAAVALQKVRWGKDASGRQLSDIELQRALLLTAKRLSAAAKADVLPADEVRRVLFFCRFFPCGFE